MFCAITSCTTQANATVSGTAEFTLPVPMGSPQNYYGVGTYLYNTVNTNHNNNNLDTGWDPEGGTVTGGTWTSPTNAATANSIYTTTATNNAAQQWNTFGLQSGTNGVPNDGTSSIDGLEVQLANVYYSSGSGRQLEQLHVKVEVSWNAGTSWSTAQNTSALNTTTTTDKILGSSSSTSSWGGHSWAYSDFSNTNFRVRLTWTQRHGNAGGAGRHGEPRPADRARHLPHGDHHHDLHRQHRHGHLADGRLTGHPGLLGRDHHPRRQSRERRSVQPGERQLEHQWPHVDQP